jgi:hypothetical protein
MSAFENGLRGHLAAIVAELGEQEVSVLIRLAERLQMGQATYRKGTRMAQPALAETWPAPARETPPKPHRKRRARRKKPVLRLVKPRRARYFAVCCGVCDAIGPLARRPARATPPKQSGWVEREICGLTIWLCEICCASYRRRLPPATRGDCIDGPRPCPHSLCRYHLQECISRKASKDFELTETCVLDVVDKHPKGMTLNEIGQIISMTREGPRYIEVHALEKVRAAGIDMEDPPEQPEHPLVQWAHE